MKDIPAIEELAASIARAFPESADAVSDSFIEANPDINWLKSPVDLHIVVPAYMAWCVRNPHRRDTLIPDFTVSALAEFGRSKNPAIKHLNFKHTCSAAQRAVVAEFLQWCLDPERLLLTEQIERSLKHWLAFEERP
jgi:hypothetical protein